MIAEKDSIESSSTNSLPNSRKVYVAGEIHRDIRVPFLVIPREAEGSLDISVRL